MQKPLFTTKTDDFQGECTLTQYTFGYLLYLLSIFVPGFFGRSVGRSVSRSVKQPVSQSFGQSVSQSVT